MTEKEYYLWSNTGDFMVKHWGQTNSRIGEFMQVLQLFVFFLAKMYIAALGFEFCNSILTNKIPCTYHEMQCK